MENLELFDLPPKEKHGQIENTNIEHLVIAFDQGKKREMIRMLEELCNASKTEVYADYLFKVIKEKYEEINSRI